MTTQYDYLNARIRGMGSRLFTASFYETLLEVSGTETVTDALLDSEYGPELREALTVKRGPPAVESALGRNMVRTFGNVCHHAPDGPRRLLKTQLLAWEMANVRAILRGKMRGADDADILAAVRPVGEWAEARLTELCAQPDAMAVVDLLVVWEFPFAFEIRRLVSEHRNPPDFQRVDRGLSELFFAWALRTTGRADENCRVLRQQLRRQIDLQNLLAVLRGIEEQPGGATAAPVEPIPGGLLSAAELKRISDCSLLMDAFEILSGTFFAPAIERGVLAFGESGKLGVLERFFEIVVIQAGVRVYRRSDPLGLGVPLGYLWRKLNEVLNLRIIMRGKHYDMSPNRIREELCFV